MIRMWGNMNEAKIKSMMLASMLLLSMSILYSSTGNAVTVYLDPQMIIIGVGETLAINVTIAEVIDLCGWDFTLYYQNDILNCTGVSEGLFLKSASQTFFNVTDFTDAYNATHGLLRVVCVLLGPVPGVNGSGVLAVVTFNAIALGNTILDLTNTQLRDSKINALAHNTVDGYVEVRQLLDIGIISVTPSATQVYEGDIVNIVIAIKNDGTTVAEFFNVTTYYGDAIIEKQNVSDLNPGEEITLTFTWNTTGVTPNINYTIWAEASQVPDEINIENNVFVDGTVYIKKAPDVAVVSLASSHTAADVGQIVNINVTSRNYGDAPETFNVTVYYDDAVVGEQVVSSLAPADETTLLFSWNTTGVTPDVNYTIWARASEVPHEVNVENNIFSDGTIYIGVGLVPGITTIYVNPSTIGVPINEAFSIDVTIANVTDLYGWDVGLYYRNDVLNATEIVEGAFLEAGGETSFYILDFNDAYNATHGWIWAVCLLKDLYLVLAATEPWLRSHSDPWVKATPP